MDSHVGFFCTEGGGGFSCRVRQISGYPDIFKDIFKILRFCQEEARKTASSIGKMFQMCMLACFIWNNVPVNCIIQNHCFDIGYEMFVNARGCVWYVFHLKRSRLISGW